MIVTTNFDRLIESALESVGITPLVIATADQAAGAPPLAHNQCTIIKTHGDYLDTRIRNSEAELTAYEPELDALLDQVFDEYGLIVCGWSGEYDAALRAAIERCKSRRYTTYWCAHGTLSAAAEKLVNHRAAELVPITDADSFFDQIIERVTAIREVGTRHPLETHAAVETLKRYLSEERYRIRLRELVREATEELVAQVRPDAFPPGADFSNAELTARTKKLEALCETSLAMMANGCYWGAQSHDDAWIETARRLAEFEVPQSGRTAWLGLFRYPALLHLYAGGTAAVAKGRYDLLAALFLQPCRSADTNEARTLVQASHPSRIVAEGVAHVLFPHPEAPRTKYRAPLSQYLQRTLRPAFSDVIPSDEDYVEAFERFEYLACLVHQDLSGFGIEGLFVWRGGLHGIVGSEIETARGDWPPLRAGLFDGSIERLQEVKSAVDQQIARRRW